MFLTYVQGAVCLLAPHPFASLSPSAEMVAGRVSIGRAEEGGKKKPPAVQRKPRGQCPAGEPGTCRLGFVSFSPIVGNQAMLGTSRRGPCDLQDLIRR